MKKCPQGHFDIDEDLDVGTFVGLEDVKYCPICGTELVEEDDDKAEDTTPL